MPRIVIKSSATVFEISLANGLHRFVELRSAGLQAIDIGGLPGSRMGIRYHSGRKLVHRDALRKNDFHQFPRIIARISRSPFAGGRRVGFVQVSA